MYGSNCTVVISYIHGIKGMESEQCTYTEINRKHQLTRYLRFTRCCCVSSKLNQSIITRYMAELISSGVCRGPTVLLSFIFMAFKGMESEQCIYVYEDQQETSADQRFEIHALLLCKTYCCCVKHIVAV